MLARRELFPVHLCHMFRSHDCLVVPGAGFNTNDVLTICESIFGVLVSDAEVTASKGEFL